MAVSADLPLIAVPILYPMVSIEVTVVDLVELITEIIHSET